MKKFLTLLFFSFISFAVKAEEARFDLNTINLGTSEKPYIIITDKHTLDIKADFENQTKVASIEDQIFFPKSKSLQLIKYIADCKKENLKAEYKNFSFTNPKLKSEGDYVYAFSEIKDNTHLMNIKNLLCN